jgi:hypothetical protein
MLDCACEGQVWPQCVFGPKRKQPRVLLGYLGTVSFEGFERSREETDCLCHVWGRNGAREGVMVAPADVFHVVGLAQIVDDAHQTRPGTGFARLRDVWLCTIRLGPDPCSRKERDGATHSRPRRTRTSPARRRHCPCRLLPHLTLASLTVFASPPLHHSPHSTRLHHTNRPHYRPSPAHHARSRLRTGTLPQLVRSIARPRPLIAHATPRY